MGQIFRVAVRRQGEPAVGQNNMRPFVENPADHTPFTRHQLIWPIDVRVAKVCSGRMALQNFLFGDRNEIGETQLLLACDHWKILWCGNR